MDFPDLLRLIEERSVAFQAAIDSAPSLDLPVPSCPGWTLADLERHLIDGRRKWAAIVAAGPADAPPPAEVWAGDGPLAVAAQLLVEALRATGPDKACWTWWGDSQSPQNTYAAARHQLQEIAVHTYDAQLAAGAPQPLPEAIALDGVDEFVTTCVATTSPWPHEPNTLDYHATEGRSWRLTFSAEGARSGPPGDEPADVTVTAPAGDLVLLCYGRIGPDAVKVDGDRRVIDRLIAWEPE
ncbi:maleylpyruvate isomerase family mycothiol-dependent enzyme [Paractinoplanes lichenicola]|uniref:Maleylpyruvate isomerase family mycothiol-dependent enzyme n=1 Tax=Paractinoplanes lichenicola TaxID=2802976 RepID=A0ABS1VZB6_9ACTN|nr:maleylpyruvate isomerase family mycothiol-dependent enzyme [Actinoplanes lichenicola]MBL7259768.1 maleylpyruvate isomerase family mycothiol-dependent enzyme [Actinoplanes lichenicola]